MAHRFAHAHTWTLRPDLSYTVKWNPNGMLMNDEWLRQGIEV